MTVPIDVGGGRGRSLSHFSSEGEEEEEENAWSQPTLETRKHKDMVVDRILQKLLARQQQQQQPTSVSSSQPSSPIPTVVVTTATTTTTSNPNYSPSLSPSLPPSSKNIAHIAQQLASARRRQQKDHNATDTDTDTNAIIAALESQIHQLQVDNVAVLSSKRRAEQKLTTVEAQVGALSQSLALQKRDWEATAKYLKQQLETKSQYITRLEHHAQKQTEEIDELRKGKATVEETQKRLKNKAIGLEERVEDIQSALKKCESRNVSLEAANKGLEEAKRRVEDENQRMRQGAESGRREVWALREELSEARDQLEKALSKVTSSRDAEESLREAMVQRSVLAQETKSLRGEINRLQNALLDEKASNEQLQQKWELKSAAATHETAMLRSKLTTKTDQVKANKTIIEGLKSDIERLMEVYDTDVAALKDKISQGKRAGEEIKRVAREELKAEEARWEERTHTAVEKATIQHEKRIQDLEIQLMFFSSSSSDTLPPTQNARVIVTGSGSSGNGGTMAGCILDYIPRSEHVRLMELRCAAREAEARQGAAAAKAQLMEDAQKQVEKIQKELNGVKEELEKAVQVGRDGLRRAERAEGEVVALRTRCTQLQVDLDTYRGRADSTSEQLSVERSKHAAATAALNDQLEHHIQRGDAACAGLEQALEASKVAENSKKEVEKWGIQLQEEVCQFKERCASLEKKVACSEESNAESQHVCSQLSDKIVELQQQCAIAEQGRTELERMVQELEEFQRNVVHWTHQLESLLFGCLGTSEHGNTAITTNKNNNERARLESRLEAILRQCRLNHAQLATSFLTAQTLEQDLANTRARLTYLEQQYAADMAVLEKTARQQVQNIRSEAEAAIHGLRRPSSVLQHSILQQQQRNDGSGGSSCTLPVPPEMALRRDSSVTLALQVEELKAKLAEQRKQADDMEKREAQYLEQAMHIQKQ